ncbi:MAG: VPDSG-CTERM sorting domain-containing protein [Verrucomicrobia bacterium]|nr:VPDSG-CTERM sorting domain-containing protein [Verrucomicrobiota bacterium]
MKKSLFFAFAFIGASAVPASATLIYSQNFDTVGQAALTSPGAGNSAAIGTVLPGWAVTANNANQANVVIGNGATGGYGVGAYLATGNGTDFSLSSYQTGAGAVTFITYTFVNSGATTLTDLVGSFDYESGWSRSNFASLRTAGFEVGMTYVVTPPGGSPVSSTPGNTWHVDNSKITLAADVTTWLTDARMDVLGLSDRDKTFTLPGVTLAPGASLTLKWAQSVYAGDKNMAQGIDNFKLGDNNSLAPAATPDGGTTLVLLGGALTGLGALRRKIRA